MGRSRQSEPLRERQARVGIIANPAEVHLPTHLPRDIWNRWPDLRSKRRLRRQGQANEKPARFADPVLDGALLDQLMSEYRKRRSANSGLGASGQFWTQPGRRMGETVELILSKSEIWLTALRKLQRESVSYFGAKLR